MGVSCSNYAQFSNSIAGYLPDTWGVLEVQNGTGRVDDIPSILLTKMLQECGRNLHELHLQKWRLSAECCETMLKYCPNLKALRFNVEESRRRWMMSDITYQSISHL